MREVHTIAPAFTIGLWGLSVEKQNFLFLCRAAAYDYFYCRLIYWLFFIVDSSIDYFSIHLFIIFLSVDEFFS